MTREVVTATPDERIEEACEKMQRRHIRHLVVVDAKDRPVGLASLRTLAQAGLERAADQLRSLEAFVGADGPGG
jgi:CBS domain-containing protein